MAFNFYFRSQSTKDF